MPSTHEGARADFTKLNLTAGLNSQRGAVTASASLRGQISFGKPMFNSEQLGLEGGDAPSSLSPRSYALDEGVTLRGELARSMPIGASSDIAVFPYVFAAVGGGRLHNPIAV